ncbi:MAG: dihydrodipicolinate reductase [Thermodesulfobacteriota bacterium]
MEPINIMVNGIPGNVAVQVATHVQADGRFSLVPYSLTGPEIETGAHRMNGVDIQLIRPEHRDGVIQEIQAAHDPFISIDFTHPSAVNPNAEFYCRHRLPFVMGTTGGDRERLDATVRAAAIPAVIAPNMAKQIVGFQAMMAYAADNFPGLFEGYSLDIRESHQQGKADTSGTAKAMVSYFNRLGCDFSEEAIVKERDPETQKNRWGIPEEYLSGHAWHTYTLTSPDQTTTFSFTHNVNGRKIYVRGTLDAVIFLADQVGRGVQGRAFTMIDVLKGA